jgi:HEAT repeat protein/type 1 glutamine amidotransferase
MHRITGLFIVTFLLVADFHNVIGAESQGEDGALEAAFNVLPRYEYGQSRQPLAAIDDAIVASHEKEAMRSQLEHRLVDIIDGNATAAAKQYACRELSLIGTSYSVSALAKLLTNAELSHMGRYALERIGGPDSANALRQALATTEGKVKIGIINSLAVIEDQNSVTELISLLNSSDTQISAAAADSLGKIGTGAAADALMDFRNHTSEQLRPDATLACLNVANRLLRQGDVQRANKIFQMLYSTEKAEHIRVAAFQGVISSYPSKPSWILIEALHSNDRPVRVLAGDLIRQMPQGQSMADFIGSLAQLPADGQVVLMDALAAREESAARYAVINLVDNPDNHVGVAAIRTLAKIGQASDVALLVKIISHGDSNKATEAIRALGLLRGKGVDDEIAASLAKANPETRVVLINCLVTRSAKETTKTISSYLAETDPNVRLAAVDAVGKLGDETYIPSLFRILNDAKNDTQRRSAEKALAAICNRTPGPSFNRLLECLDKANTEARCALLRLLGRTKSNKAFDVIREATVDPEAAVRDTAVRLLSDWPDESAAPFLLQIASTTKEPVHEVLALRGYIQLVRTGSASNDKKLEMLKGVISLAQAPSEKKLIIAALGDIHTVASFELVKTYLDDPNLIQEARIAAAQIITELGPEYRQQIGQGFSEVPSGWWWLNDGQGSVAVHSGLLYQDGVLYGDPNRVAGKISGAIDFNGNDEYVEIPAIKPSSDCLTVMAWIKARSWRDETWKGNIVANDSISGGNQGFALRCGNHGELSFVVGAEDAWPEVVTGANQMTSGIWYHVAGTYDGTSLRVYVNGTLRGETKVPVRRAVSASVLNIARSPLTHQCFDGAIEDVRIYNRALSQSEIEVVAAAADDIICWWSFDDVNGNTVPNSGILGSGWNGTLTSVASLVPGMFGKALDFDGKISIDVHPIEMLSNAVTVSACIKANKWGPGIFNGPIVANVAFDEQQGPRGWALECGENGRVQFAVGANKRWVSAATGPILQSGTWYCVGGTYDGNVIKTYVNGEIAAETEAADGIISSMNPVHIGANPLLRVYFDGAIDDVRISNRALSQNDIKSFVGAAKTPIKEAVSKPSQPARKLDLSVYQHWTTGGGKKTRILLIGCKPDHPFGTHMYLQECCLLAKCLKQLPNVDVIVSDGWPKDANALADLNAIALYSSPGAEMLLDGDHSKKFEELMKAGVGLAAIHWSTGLLNQNNAELGDRYLKYLGGLFSFAFSKLVITDREVICLEPNHPVLSGCSFGYQLHDEFYIDLRFVPGAQPILKVNVDSKDQTVAWIYERSGGGRSYGNTLGHFHENFAIEPLRRSIVNGILWVAHYDIPKNGAVCEISEEDMRL